jgi:hypothetical protein
MSDYNSYNSYNYGIKPSLIKRLFVLIRNSIKIGIASVIAIALGFVSLLFQTIIYAVLIALPVWLLWNNLGAAILHCPTFSFWQVMGMLVMGRLIYTGIVMS